MDSYQAVYDAVRSRIHNGDVGYAVSEVARQAFDISFAVQHITHDLYRTIAEHRRPSVLMRPRIFVDGNQWCVLYGENLQDGVTGFGDTPDAAAMAFDDAWINQKAPPLRTRENDNAE